MFKKVESVYGAVNSPILAHSYENSKKEDYMEGISITVKNDFCPLNTAHF